MIKGKEMRMRLRLREEMAFEEKDAKEMNYVAWKNKSGFTRSLSQLKKTHQIIS